jgi:hypothetical protein
MLTHELQNTSGGLKEFLKEKVLDVIMLYFQRLLIPETFKPVSYTV